MTEFNTETQEWEDAKEEVVSADQADAAMAEAVKQALASKPVSDEEEAEDDK